MSGPRADAVQAPGLTAGRAAVLGTVQGPTELLPVSSSAHLSLIPRLAGWGWTEIDPEARKSFEVALHAGTAAALLIGQRHEIAAELAAFDARRAALVALSFIPPALAGYGLERQIESRLGGPRTIAAGLVAGAVAMVVADRRPQERGPGDAGLIDGLALGVAQATALVPGVSRNGATLTAARARRFTREHANLLSRTVALPVIVGATALKGVRLRRRGISPGLGRAMASGVAASFASTMASQRLIGLVERDRALWPYAAYRVALATAVAVRMKR
jgi:undecaprenyl-diphosphatase